MHPKQQEHLPTYRTSGCVAACPPERALIRTQGEPGSAQNAATRSLRLYSSVVRRLSRKASAERASGAGMQTALRPTADCAWETGSGGICKCANTVHLNEAAALSS